MSLKDVIWLGNSREIISGFPDKVRMDLGFQLYLLQNGREPLRSRPMKSIGSGVFELKEQDESGWYRVIYVAKCGRRIYILHCFKKQSAKTGKKDLLLAKQRLKELI